MTKTGEKIVDVAIGDEIRIQRIYTGLPTGINIVKAWFTVKRSERDTDANALFPSKVITTSLTAAGHITDADTAEGTIAMFFDLAKTDTGVGAVQPNIEYVYDVQVKVSDGAIHTLEKGTIAFIRGVTDAAT